MIISYVPVPNVATVNKKFPNINFSSQNVCSLNVSKPGRKTYAKLAAITRSGTEVIFLSDVRLNSNKQIASVNDIEKKLKFLGYNLYHNSKHNKSNQIKSIYCELTESPLDRYIQRVTFV